MYDELVKRLRHSANLAERGLITPRSELCAAADAIEGLTALSRRQEVELVELTGELASKPRWVPVTERLPDKGQKVLIYWREAGEPAIDTAFWQGEWAALHWTNMGDKVTHWMPLPEPPKEET